MHTLKVRIVCPLVFAFGRGIEAGCQRLARYGMYTGAMLLLFHPSFVFADKYDVPTVMPNGCTMYIRQLPDPNLTITVFRAEGACKNGLAEGFWSVGMERSQVRLFVYRSNTQGQLSGVSLSLGASGANIAVVIPELNGTRMIEYLKRDSSPVEMERFLSFIDDANLMARRLKKPAGDAAKMKSLISKWKQGDDSIFDEWITGTGISPVGDPSALGNSGRDDPKTGGRGMRGG